MISAKKILLLNKLLEKYSTIPNDLCIWASQGVQRAAFEDFENFSLEDFAKKILQFYNPNIAVEVLEVNDSEFSPLFAIPQISQAVKRLSGFDDAILVVYGLTPNGGDGKKSTSTRRNLYAQNLDFIESYVMRYADTFSNFEIIFV